LTACPEGGIWVKGASKQRAKDSFYLTGWIKGVGENCIMRSFIICTVRQSSLE
jgi:hypothetical protein